jgi:uncharacterized OB-fold protein
VSVGVDEGALELERPAPPQPTPDVDSKGFWDGVRDGRFVLCRCRYCRHWLQPPLERCMHCCGETGFEDVTGAGTIYSFIVVHHPSVPAFATDLPYVVALVELDEGVRFPGRLLDERGPRVRVGQRVRAEIVDVPGGERSVAFRLDPAA